MPKSTNLCIRVMEGAVVNFELKFGAEAAGRLPNADS